MHYYELLELLLNAGKVMANEELDLQIREDYWREVQNFFFLMRQKQSSGAKSSDILSEPIPAI